MNLSEIKTNPKNPRLIKDARFKQLKKSIEDLPHMMALRPIVIDETGTVLGGNMRLEALKSLGYKEVPDEWVKRTDELSEEQKKEFVIKDNAGFGEWDWDQLANEWSEYPLADWGVDIPEDWAASPTVEEDESAVAEMIDKAAELQKKWKVERGQIWEIGRHRLMCGDSTSREDVAWLTQGQSTQAIVTSPPYGVGMDYEESEPEFEKTVALVSSVLRLYADQVRDNGFAFVNFGERWVFPEPMGAMYCRLFAAEGWRWFAARYWKRSTVALAIWNTTQPRPMSDMECCWTWQKGSGSYPVHDLSISKESLWLSEGDDDRQPHQAQMHISIAKKAIVVHSDTGDAISEPFSGTGTTIVASESLGRACHGMEIEPKYCAVTLERLSALGLTPRLAETKQ